MKLVWYNIPSPAGNVVSRSIRRLAGNAPVAAGYQHAGDISLGLHMGAAAPMEAMTRVVSGSFVSARVLTQQGFDAILAGRPDFVRAQLKEIYTDVMAEESVQRVSSNSCIIADSSREDDGDFKTRASKSVEISQTPRASYDHGMPRLDLKSVDVNTARKGEDGKSSSEEQMAVLMAEVREIKTRLSMHYTGSAESVYSDTGGHGITSPRLSARSAGVQAPFPIFFMRASPCSVTVLAPLYNLQSIALAKSPSSAMLSAADISTLSLSKSFSGPTSHQQTKQVQTPHSHFYLPRCRLQYQSSPCRYVRVLIPFQAQFSRQLDVPQFAYSYFGGENCLLSHNPAKTLGYKDSRRK